MELLVHTAVVLIVGIATGLVFEPALGLVYRALRQKKGHIRATVPPDFPARMGFIFAGADIIRAYLTGAGRYYDDAYWLFTLSVGVIIGCHVIECWKGLPRH